MVANTESRYIEYIPPHEPKGAVMKNRIPVLVTVVALTALCALAPVQARDNSIECTTYMAGTDDNFAYPYEPTTPSPMYQDYADMFWPQATYRQFDQPGTDVALIHTFVFPEVTGRICRATIEMRVRAGSSSLVDNDSFRFSLKGGANPQESHVYWRTFRWTVGAGTFPPGTEAVMKLDLADLPGTYFPNNILSKLSDRELEVMVEDDTMVDYIKLTVCKCQGPMFVATEDGLLSTWGAVKALYDE